ncbi:hypothetical protein AUC70_03380 [Methyloceanibacter stevinii]|uniref:Uncharacterized protein n=1 Tax=Methyloceanibacter stevinii TaxID=1774970 RepID=A0A1E3VQW7_9HYPH|nr:hypothetical protein [Methyloceanibacter stevinii]ODR95912.1 hypothetical protein AUC70_03380 [Methyloceanibacter stevinii]
MPSEKQIAANRSNSKKSTGPKTQIGKARSRQNAWKHGLTAEEIVIRGETPDDFNVFRDGLMADFDPQGTMECELVDRLAGLLWRLRRVPSVEAQVMSGILGRIFMNWDISSFTDQELDQLEELAIKAEDAPSRESAQGQPFGIADNSETRLEARRRRANEMLSVVTRHETGLMNAVMKTLSLLHGLQSARLAKTQATRTIEGQ